jgi:hypothetical protein
MNPVKPMKIKTAIPTHDPGPRDDSARRAAQQDRAALERALEVAGSERHGNAWRCPFHEDRRPSGSVYRGEDGAWRFRCHGCGVCEDVFGVRAKASGRAVGDILTEARQSATPAKPFRVFPDAAAVLASVGRYAIVEDHYPYTDPATGRLDLLVIRCRDSDGGKSYLQASPIPGGGLVMRRPAAPYPLFNRGRLAAAGRVVVVEGEKCVKALHALGVVATTSPAGAENADKADWSPLAGKPEVVLWRDNDAAGERYARDVAEILSRLPEPPGRVLWVDVPALDLPEKGDADDFVRRINPSGDFADAAAEAVQTVLSRAAPRGPAAKVRRLIDDTISGKRRAVPWPWPMLGELTNALMPGMVTVLCGGGGSTKTYWLIQAARYWHKDGVPFAFQALEEHEDGTHLFRAMVQESVCSDLLDLEWVRRNGEEARQIQDDHQGFLDSFGRHLWAVPGHIPALADLTDWVRDRAKEGARVIAIDPVTAADSSDKPWAEDKAFIRNTQSLMLDFGCSLVLVTHPKKGAAPAGGNNWSMDGLAGGAAYQRHTQTVLWLRYYDRPKAVTCSRRMAGQLVEGPAEINRSIRIFKATNGRGTGADVGYSFGPGMLFKEHGLVMPGRDDE